MIKAIIFDMDGVVINSEDIHRKSFNLCLSKYGIKFEYGIWGNEYAGVGTKEIIADVFKKGKINADIEKVSLERKSIFLELIKKENLETIKGFKEFFKQVTISKLKYILVSASSNIIIEECLKKVGLFKKINFIGRQDYKERKPNPESFLKASKTLKVKPSECLVFEDTKVGVLAAKAAGMKVVALTSTTLKKNLQGADMYIDNFTGLNLKELLEKFK